jgi:radical SAM superfamily enzyme YgiQ (UPF0313 family)
MAAMDIVFVHSPVRIREVPNRKQYWDAFDDVYGAAHPSFRPLRRLMWELPHWIPWLAGVLGSYGYDSIQILELYRDCGTLDGIDEGRIYQEVRTVPGDLYLFSPMTTNLPQALRIAAIVKEAYPSALVVFGGVVASPLHEEIAHQVEVDYVIRGRGELALPALITALESGGNLESVANLTYSLDGRLVVNARTYPDVHPSQIAFPNVSVFPASVGQDVRYLRVNYALGCPFTCDFCTIQTIGRSPRYFAVSRVLQEIRAYKNYYGDHHHIYFGDETFTLNLGQTKQLCEALAREGDILFDCQTRLNCLRGAGLPQTLYDSGCRWLEVGLETTSQSTQNLFKQHTVVGSIDRTLRELRDAGVATCTFTMLGLPNESKSEMQRTTERICQLISDRLLTASYVSIFVPYPGSRIYADPASYGVRINHRRFDEYHEDLPPVFQGPYATCEQVYEVFLDSVVCLTQAMNSAK